MRIPLVSVYKPVGFNLSSLKKENNVKLNSLPFDTVSFSGKKEKIKKADEKTVNKILCYSMEYQGDADLIYEDAKRVYKEVLEAFKKGNEVAPNGKVIRRVYKKPDTSTIHVEEYSPNDSSIITRQAEILNGKIESISQGVKIKLDGTEETSKYYTFSSDGSLYSYSEDLDIFPDGSVNVGRYYTYNGTELSSCSIDWRLSSDFTGTADSMYDFSSGMLDCYKEGCKFNKNGSQEFQKVYKKTYNGWTVETK